MNRKPQQGVGLIEVLVALLILAIGVLGFVALQVRAMEATVEGGHRIQAINIARDLAERMRINRAGASTYLAELSDATKQKTFGTDCSAADCDATKIADYDVAQVVNYGSALGMTMNMMTCPKIINGRQCIYVAWGDTSATDGLTDGDCTNSEDSTYMPTSTCVIMETY